MTQDATTTFDDFVSRHNGPRPDDVAAMLETLGHATLDDLMAATIPAGIRLGTPLRLPPAQSERDALDTLRRIASQNQVFRSYIGMGYADCITPPVILRNVLENPGWYTAYTPYQPEIAQGRLEALLNFQTMVGNLTGLPVANASLLDEGTAAAEALTLTLAVVKHGDRPVFLVDHRCHPQTIAVVQTRGRWRGIDIRVGDPAAFTFGADVVGALVQYPATDGEVRDFRKLCTRAHESGALVTAATDLLACTLLTPPGEWGADIAVGSSQRFGVPMGYGGPHAAFFATRETYKRHLPGRIIGVSQDTDGRMAFRMALQTREQHIRREKATSNICTAQVLLAVIAGMYAVYHGPEGLRRIARRVHTLTGRLADAVQRLGFRLAHATYFDTLTIEVGDARAAIEAAARERRLNLRRVSETHLGVALDETTTAADLADLVDVFAAGTPARVPLDALDDPPATAIPGPLTRATGFLEHPVFHRYRSETEMLRYLKRLEDRDLSLTSAMIPLGSCTMKLNATAEMIPVTWREFGGLHPFAPRDQTQGYATMFRTLEEWLAEITGLPGVSLQ
ncbi:MAG: glycine dehydrogenase (aminomethyl-transferring), partial [Gemmatimonadota bacterium]|nr:glycine dehydrogenase (aminomethyl-transferring) [Gemmatimonadota bacterium]